MVCSVKIKLLLLSLLLVWFSGVEPIAPNRNGGNKAKLQAQLKKVRRQTVKRDLKEKSRGYAKNFHDVNAFGGGDDTTAARAAAEYSDGAVELFVRRQNAGFWTYFRTLEFTNSSNDPKIYMSCFRTLCDGGLQAEQVREEVEQHIALSVFGSGLGEPLLYRQVLEEMKQFKKVRAKQMEFGYRVLQKDNDDYVTLLDRSMTRISHSRIDSLVDLPAATPVDLQQILMQASSLEEMNNILPITDALKGFLDEVNDNALRKVVICADGSALLRGKTVIAAGVGIYLAAYESVEVTKTSESKAPDNSFMGADAATVHDHLCNSLAAPVSVSMKELGGIITTPFDAELLAGVAAMCFISYFKKIRPNLDIDVLFLSDSKSLLRTMRNVRITDSDDNSTEIPSTNEDTSKNRKEIIELLRRICSSFDESALRYTASSYAAESRRTNWNETFDDRRGPHVTARWTAAHPERKDMPPQRWQMHDQVVWITDALAQSSFNASQFSSTTGKRPRGIDASSSSSKQSQKEQLNTGHSNREERVSSRDAIAVNVAMDLQERCKIFSSNRYTSVDGIQFLRWIAMQLLNDNT